MTLKSFSILQEILTEKLGLKDKFDDLTLDQALDLLASDGMLIKRPLLVKDNKILQIGYRTKYKDLNLV